MRYCSGWFHHHRPSAQPPRSLAQYERLAKLANLDGMPPHLKPSPSTPSSKYACTGNPNIGSHVTSTFAFALSSTSTSSNKVSNVGARSGGRARPPPRSSTPVAAALRTVMWRLTYGVKPEVLSSNGSSAIAASRHHARASWSRTVASSHAAMAKRDNKMMRMAGGHCVVRARAGDVIFVGYWPRDAIALASMTWESRGLRGCL